MAIEQEQRRWIELGGCYNFRDLGGYVAAGGRQVRWRRLFRSDGLHALTAGDVEHLHELGLAVVIDLRSSNEIERDGLGALFDTGRVVHRHHPFIERVEPRDPSSYPSDMVVLYQEIIDNTRPAIAAIFGALSQEETYPVVFHCAAGKDRTGITAGLVLSVLGVPDETIIQDYALTELAMERRRAAIQTAGAVGETDRYSSISAHLLRAEPQTMARTLAMIDATYGSSTAFLEACGVTIEQVNQVREILLT